MRHTPESFRKLLKEPALNYLLTLTSALEKEWEPEGLLYFSSLVETFAESTDREMNKIFELWQRLMQAPSFTVKMFADFVVPLERALGRELRDDDFVILEGDRIEAEVEKIPLYVVLDNLRSSFNVGSIFRTAECLGVSKIFLCGYTPNPEQHKISRTALGTDQFVQWQQQRDTLKVIADLKAQGIQVLALETLASAPELTNYKCPSPVALVFGNERFGLDDSVLKAVDQVVKLPMSGMKNSLNVGVALGVAGFEIARQWRNNLREKNSE